jgi:hypothetical protein
METQIGSLSQALTPQSEKLEERWDTLKDRRETPRPLARPEVGSEADPAGSDGTDVPEAVVDGGKSSTMLRMRELRDEHGRGHLSETVSEANEDTTDQEG